MTRPIIVAAINTFLILGVGVATKTVGPWYRNLRQHRPGRDNDREPAFD